MVSKSSVNSSTNSFPRVLLGCVCILLIVAGSALWFRSDHGQLGEKGHDFSVALFSACNLKDSNKVEEVARMIESAQQDGSISAGEVRWLMDIVNDTRDERWDRASKTLRHLMNVQAVPNRALPELD